VEKFIAQRNILHFEGLLSNESDPKERRILESMLREERAKLVAAEAAVPAQDRGRRVRDTTQLPC
jgi:hypothetical protein